MRTIAFCGLVLAAWSVHAQVVNVRGRVSDAAGKPVANAVVAIKSLGLKDTTSLDGAYSIAQGALAVAPGAGLRPDALFLEGGELVVALGISSPLVIELRDVSGALLSSRVVPDLGEGVHRIPLAPPAGRSGLFVVRVSAGTRTVSLRGLSMGNDAGWKPATTEAPRTLATVDTLVATATGYATSRTPLSSYDQTVDVVLDSVQTVVRSAGCDKTRTLANGTLSLQSGGKTRKYILGAPATYDKSHAYRLVFAYAESGSSAQSVANRNFFRMGTYDAKNTIFVAPDAENGAGTWSKTDVDFTDAILAQVESDLCIDKTRIFATGFSFGGAMSLALACTRADVFRGVAFFSGADLTGSCPSTPLSKPIAYYASQASGDASGAPIPTSGRIKQAQFAAVNGCTAEPDATTFPAAGKAHTCTVYKNCKAGYPTVYCVFNGAHGWEPVDPGQSTSWNPPEAWKFITQF